MSYDFKFDLSKISQNLFDELYFLAGEKKIRKTSKLAQKLLNELPFRDILELPPSIIRKIVRDFAKVHLNNISHKEAFKETENRALFLPHCARKFMDNRCHAKFHTDLSYYECQECSEDCIINEAQKAGNERGYDVYITPGGSCIPKILKKKGYDGVVGVACSIEIDIADDFLSKMNVPYQAVPLIKNGCSQTDFMMGELKKKL